MEIIDYVLCLSNCYVYNGDDLRNTAVRSPHDLSNTEVRSPHDDPKTGNRRLRDISSISVSLLQWIYV
jgi:hypothetical protein